MLGNVIAAACAWLFAVSPQPEALTWADLLEKLKQSMPMPWLWILLSMGAVAFLFLIDVGDKLAGIFGSPFTKAQTSDTQIQNIRNALLRIVRHDADARLAASLHELVKLDLYMEDQQQSVGKSKLDLVPEDSLRDNDTGLPLGVNRVLYEKGHNKSPLAPKLTQKIIEIFKRPDIQGRLLILGEPGAGKTTELLHLARELMIRAAQDQRCPVPIILELSSWKGENINRWVESQLKNQFSISKAVTRQWLEAHQILLLLDGLDELGLVVQIKCIQAINQFLELTHTPELVVCCRKEEYEAGQIELTELKGIVLENLKAEQIRQYFFKLNRLSLWDSLSNNSTLMELAKKPLFLFMLVVAYQGKTIRNEQELFNVYIQKQICEPRNQGNYKQGKAPTKKQTQQYLVWLAKQMERIGKTEFLIEEIQPSWLFYNRQKTLYMLMGKLIVGLLFGLPFGLIHAPMAVADRLFIVLFIALPFGLMSELTGGLWSEPSDIEPREQTKWSPIGGLLGGLLFGLIGGLIGELDPEVNSGLISGLIGGLFGVLLGGLGNNPIQEKKEPNQGIKKSIKNGLIVMLITGLICGLIAGLSEPLSDSLFIGLAMGYFGGLSFGLFFGLGAPIQHFTLRVVLTMSGNAPWNYALFLEHAISHRFMQRNGGRYRFVHDLLRKHFARMS
jgi:DNA polymerase III delta prime subunit